MDKDYAKYLLNKTREDYNLISGHFSSTRQNLWKDLEPLFDYTGKGEKILDLGCGNGRFYETFRKKGADYSGVDNSEELIKIAKEKNPEADFRLGDILAIPFAENYFGKVYCIAVLHHIPSKELRFVAMKELARVLKPSGQLILTAWNIAAKKNHWLQISRNFILKIFGASKLDIKDVMVPWKDKDGKVIAQRYIHAFSKRELEKLAKSAGLKVEDSGLTSRPEGKDNNFYLVARKV